MNTPDVDETPSRIRIVPTSSLVVRGIVLSRKRTALCGIAGRARVDAALNSCEVLHIRGASCRLHTWCVMHVNGSPSGS